MRRGARLAGVLAGVAVLLPTGASAGVAERVSATFEVMAKDFIAAFQPLEGLVVGVEGDRIYLDLGEAGGAQVGQEFTVFRKGEVFHHPLTQRALGRYEDLLGHAQVKRVLPKFAEAVFVAAAEKPRPRAEDGARITRGRIKVAVTPMLDLTRAKPDVRRVPFLLATILERSKRFQVVDPLTVGDMFASGGVRAEEVLALPERAVRISKNLDVTGWVVPVLLERGGVTYLDATWISAVTGTPLFSRRQALVPATALEEQRFPWEPAVED